MDTNLYWSLRGNYGERAAKLKEFSREQLEASILDREYNDFLRGRADYSESEHDPHGLGKRLPYIGWFWRHLSFSSGSLPIGNTGEVVGFMPNNKWGYPERMTTAEEFARIMEIIDAAMIEDAKGGLLSEIIKNTNAKLDELWDYLQTIQVR